MQHIDRVSKDSSLSKWACPKNTKEHCLLWLFHNTEYSKVETQSENQSFEGIIRYVFKVICRKKDLDQSLDKIIASLQNPPFGEIQILEVNKDESEPHLILLWSMSSVIKGANLLVKSPPRNIKICLNSLVQDKNYIKVRINNQWFYYEKDKLILNIVRFVEFKNNKLEIAVMSLSGDKFFELKCGNEISVEII